MPREFDRHHLIPRSRGGRNGENRKKVRRTLHMAWHHLFFNLLPWEVIQEIADGNYAREKLSEAQQYSWDFLFGGRSEGSIFRYIRDEWYPSFEIVKECGYGAVLRTPLWKGIPLAGYRRGRKKIEIAA